MTRPNGAPVEPRVIRAISLEVARRNAERLLALAERCLSMSLHWGERAQHHRDQAFRWLKIAEAGAPLVAKDADAARAAEVRRSSARVDGWNGTAANDAAQERRSA